MGIEMKMYFKFVFILFGIFLLSACQVGKTPMSLNMQERFLTGATNKYEQPYRVYRSDPIDEHIEEIEEIGEKIIVYEYPRPTFPQNRDSESSDPEKESIDSPFKWDEDDTKILHFGRVYNQNSKEVSWTVITNDPHNGRREHSFKGTSTPLKHSEKEGLKIAAAISNTGLASSFTCLKANCIDAFVIIKQDQEQVADIYIAKERRKAKIHVEEEASQAIAKRFPKLSDLYTPNNEVDMDVIVVQTNPGFVSIRIKYRDLIDVAGELLWDGGVCTPLRFAGSVRHRGEYCMAGNNHRAGLVVNFNTYVEGREYNADIFMLEQNSTDQKDTAETEEKVEEPVVPVEVAVNEGAHYIIRQLIPDFQREAIQREARYRWLQGGRAARSMRNFLNYHHRAVTGDMSGISTEEQNKVQEFRTVMDVVKRYSFPRVIIFKTLAESRFDRFAVSGAGAVGLWQFTEPTARDYGLSSGQRTDVVRSTEAAMRYIRDLFTGKHSRPWTGDIKLAIAAYNWGQGSLGRAIEKNTAGIASQQRERGRVLSPQDTMRISSGLSSGSEGEEKNMFWALRSLNVLAHESEQHVLRVVSAIMVGLSPKDFGYENMTAFPASE